MPLHVAAGTARAIYCGGELGLNYFPCEACLLRTFPQVRKAI